MTNDEALAKADAFAREIRDLAIERGIEHFAYAIGVNSDAHTAICCGSHGTKGIIRSLVNQQVRYYYQRETRDGPEEHGERAAQG